MEKTQREPLEELVLTILSQNTTDVNRDRAWERLREEYGDWEEVRAGGRDRLEESIRVAGLASQKSATILRTLERAREDFGETSLEALKEKDDEEALSYLRSIKGVGLKTAACVLAFSLRRDVIPVDTHVHRVAERTALVPEGGTRNRTHRVLNADDGVPGPIRLPLHLLLIRHGRATCTARNPDCGDCVVEDLCPRMGVEES
ncbi:MAG: endonuclease III [Gemmatimonadota bacterium]